jgi:uncharacterized protein (TIGR03435 family)
MTYHKAALVSVTCTLLLIVRGLAAQDSPPRFEVASIKRNLSGSGSAVNGMIRGDRFTSTNVTLTQLIRAAYNVQEFQITEQPRWFDAERFDIEAKMERPVTRPEEWQPMLQSLLAERFKLVFHRENRQMTIYELVVAKNGPKLSAADMSKCDPANPACSGFNASPTAIIGTTVTMEQFAVRLARSTGRVVADKTELKGTYDLKVEWPRDDPFTSAGATASAGIFSALQEQLGLKLESARGPVEVLVIDSVSKPSEN